MQTSIRAINIQLDTTVLII